MHALSFRFQEHVGRQQQDQLLAELRSLPGIEHVDRIDPSSSQPLISRMCMAQASDRRRIDELRSQLAGMPVEDIEQPAPRHLID